MYEKDIKISDFISIIIPVYNEENRISTTLETLPRFCEPRFHRYEIIVVDDGSTDQTWEILKGFSGPEFKKLRVERNRGKGYAVREGMLRAGGRYRFFTDADLPYELGCLLTAAEVFRDSGCHLVIGARDLPQSKDRSGMGLSRRMAGKAFSFLVNAMVGIDVKDSQCGFKGFTGEAAERLFSRAHLDGYAFDVEILHLARRWDLHIRKIPVVQVERHHSKIHLVRDACRMSLDVIKLGLRRKRDL